MFQFGTAFKHALPYGRAIDGGTFYSTGFENITFHRKNGDGHGYFGQVGAIFKSRAVYPCYIGWECDGGEPRVTESPDTDGINRRGNRKGCQGGTAVKSVIGDGGQLASCFKCRRR